MQHDHYRSHEHPSTINGSGDFFLGLVAMRARICLDWRGKHREFKGEPGFQAALPNPGAGMA
jgi:hypothetical protein